MSYWTDIALQITLGVLIAIPGLLAFKNQQVSAKAYATQIIIDGAVQLHQRLQAENDELKDERDSYEIRFDLCTQRIHSLINRLDSGTPITRSDLTSLMELKDG